MFRSPSALPPKVSNLEIKEPTNSDQTIDFIPEQSWGDYIGDTIFEWIFPHADKLIANLTDKAIKSGDNFAQFSFGENYSALNEWIPKSARITVIVGNRRNLAKVADFGNNETWSRGGYNFLKGYTKAEIPTVVNLVGKEAKEMVKPVQEKLNQDPAHAFAMTYQFCERVISNWETDSLEDNMALMAVQAVFNQLGLKDQLSLDEGKLARRIKENVLRPNQHSLKFLQLKNDIDNTVDELLVENAPRFKELDPQLLKALRVNLHFILLGASSLSNLASHAIIYLTDHPQYRQELLELHASQDTLTLTAVEENEKLNDYLISFFKEVARLYGLPSVLRTASDDEPGYIKVENMQGKLIKRPLMKGGMILFSMEANQRRADIFKDPDVLDPKRFLRNGTNDAEITKMEKYWAPFSGGGHTCPVLQRYVKALFKAVVLSAIKYDFKLNQKNNGDTIVEEKPELINSLRMRI